jgi:O-antigen/teichoic acid export membrane protein
VNLLSIIRGRLAGRMLIFLSATALQVVLAVGILPLTTSILTAAEFGYFALLMSVATFANAIADGGGALALPAHYGVSSQEERRRMVASFFVISIFLSLAFAAVFVLLWPVLSPYVLGEDHGKSSWLIVGLTGLIIPLRSISAVATNIFSVSGRGNALAGQIAAQAFGTFLGTLICLFELKWETASLFAGAVAGQLASCAVSAVALGAQPWTLPSARWLEVARRHAPTAAFAGVTDGIRGISENALIAASLGVSAVGFYTHARLYYGMLMAGTNAASYNIWPTSLAEARNETREFAITYSLWAPIHILLMLFGAGFVCFGDELISILTNDRLTPAAQLVPWFVVLLLVHLSGRAQNAIVYAHGAGATTTQSRTIIAIAVLILFPFVIGNVAGIGFNLGLVGVIGLMLLEAVLFRIYLRWKATKFGRQPAFQDGLAFCGIAVIAVMWWINFVHDLTWLQRSVMFCALTVAIAVLERRRFGRLLSLIQKSK